MAGEPVLGVHLRRALEEWRRHCHANGVTYPPGLDVLVSALVAPGGQARSVFAVDPPLGEAEPMVLALEYRETAARLAVSERTVRRLIERGDLPAVEIGGCKRVRTADLAAFVASLPPTNRRPRPEESR